MRQAVQAACEERDEILGIIACLNAEERCAVAVEGRRDAEALRALGFSGNIIEFHRYGGPARFADAAASYARIVVLTDRDRAGKKIAARLVQILGRRTRLDFSYRRRIASASRGKIRATEQLASYAAG